MRLALLSPYLSWLYISLLLARNPTVIAFPSFSKSQGESLLDDFDDGGWFSGFTGVTGTILDGLWNYLLPQEIPQNPKSLPDEQTQDLPGRQNPVSPVPAIELEVTGYSSPGDNCIPEPPNSDQHSTPSTNSDPCNSALAKVIHPFDCETSGQSSDVIAVQCRAIEAALAEMVGPTGFQTYRRKCGIDFYTAPLTLMHVQIMQRINDPPIVESNPKGELSDDSDVVSDAQETPDMMQKRKQPTDLISQLNAGNDLVSVSTHPPRPQSPPASMPAYHYYKTSDITPNRQPVLVYIVDTGASLQNSEFHRQYERDGQIINENVIKQWIFVGGINSNLEDFTSYSGGVLRQVGHGTCIAQKVAGLTKGVHKDAHLIVVKYDTTLADGLSALQKIIKDLEGRRERGEDVRGYVLINMSVGWPASDIGPKNKRKLEERISRLLTAFQAIIVVTGGQNSGNYPTTDSTIKTLPA